MSIVWYISRKQKFHSKMSKSKSKWKKAHYYNNHNPNPNNNHTSASEKKKKSGKRMVVRPLPQLPHRCCHQHYEENDEDMIPGESGYHHHHHNHHHPDCRPWWLWAIGFIDIILVFIVAYSVSFTVFEEGFPIFEGREILMFILLMFSSLVQISMGAGLVCGLCSANDFTTASCLQGWLYGAYFLLLKTCFFLVVDMIKLSSIRVSDDDDSGDGEELGTIIGNCIGILRVIAVIMVQRFLDDFRATSCAITERELHERLRQMLLERIQDPRSTDLDGEYDHTDPDLY